jgi:hypothetical protein
VLGLLAAWRHRSLPNLLRTAAGAALGMGVAALYILPAAYERKWVQIDRVKSGRLEYGMSFIFAFHRGQGAGHLSVLHRVSMVAAVMFAVVAPCVAILLLRRRHWHRLQNRVFFQMAILAAVVLFLVLPVSSFVWAHTPEMAFLQFPWRWLAALAPAFGLLAGAVFGSVPRVPRGVTIVAALVLSLGMAYLAYGRFGTLCDPDETPAFFVNFMDQHMGQEGTDEYTPLAADTDDLQQDSPRVWFYLASEVADTKPTHHQELPQHAQIEKWAAQYKHFTADLPQPSVAILQLEDYPAWALRINGKPASKSVAASSGQLQIALPAGHSNVELKFDETTDRIAGDAISAVCLLLLAWVTWRERHHHHHPRTHIG